MAIDLVIVSFAFSAGIATFFSPCSVALIPAYVGYFVGLAPPDGEAGRSGEDAGPHRRHARTPWQAAVAGARFGGAAAGGILALFAVGGGLIWVLRAYYDLSSLALGRTATWLGLAVGVLVIVLGLLMLVGRGPSVALPLKAPQRRTVPGMAAFGVVFAAGSMGCTLPLLFAVLAQAFTQDVLGSVATVMAFGAGLSMLMFATSIGLSVAEDQVRAHIRRVMRFAKPASGVLLVAAGVYVIVYYLTLPPL